MTIKEHLCGLRKYHNLCVIVFVFCMMATFSFLAMHNAKNSSAASLSGFRAGNIMSDAVMGNYNTMSVQDIQNFLSSKNRCGNTNYALYQSLKASYPNIDWHWENGHFVCISEERFGDGTTIGSGQTAAEIIYQAAQDYHINPQVLLVVLQKEQGLITDDYPNSRQYRSATGFGCPDTAACDSQYYGFKNQVRRAANMFRTVLDGGWSNYPAGQTSYVQYNPNKSCGGTNVYIENRATSALYRYTPYQPNASALSAGYGTGDSCGAYGNRNFYLYFSDWFGSTQAYVNGTSITIPDGEYSLTSRAVSSRVLEIAGSKDTNGANVQLWDRTTSGSGKWRFERGSDGFYKITNVATGRVLDLSAGATHNGANIQTWSYDESVCAQKWKLYSTSDGAVTIESACSAGMVIDLAGGGTANGTNIQLYITNNTAAQKWDLYVGQTINDGIYTINSTVQKDKSIDLSGAKDQNGANVQIWSSTQVLAQRWLLTYNAAGDYYTITNPKTGRVFDLSNAKTNNGNNIQTWSVANTCAQRWKIIPRADNSYTIASTCSVGSVIDLSDSKVNNGNNIKLWSYDSKTAAQRWQFVAEPAVQEGDYTIQSSLASNKVMDLANNQTQNGNKIQIWESNETTAQQWTLKHNSQTGLYTILQTQSGKAVDVQNANMSNGTNIQLYTSNQTCAQQWYVIALEHNEYSFFSSCQINKVLDVSNASSVNGTRIWLYSSNDTNAQRWRLTKSS